MTDAAGAYLQILVKGPRMTSYVTRGQLHTSVLECGMDGKNRGLGGRADLGR